MTDMDSDPHGIREKLEIWLAAWSPGSSPWTGAELEGVFATGENAVHVVDDFEGGAVVLRSYDEYVAKWRPVMKSFRYWSIALAEEPTFRASGDLAVVTFRFQANAELADGTKLDPAPGQHGTHVWERIAGEWRLVHEHLTNV